MLLEPVGFTPTTVPGSDVSVPAVPIANPAMVDEPALDAYTNSPFGVMAFQQLALPRVGTLVLIGLRRNP